MFITRKIPPRNKSPDILVTKHNLIHSKSAFGLCGHCTSLRMGKGSVYNDVWSQLPLCTVPVLGKRNTLHKRYKRVNSVGRESYRSICCRLDVQHVRSGQGPGSALGFRVWNLILQPRESGVVGVGVEGWSSRSRGFLYLLKNITQWR